MGREKMKESYYDDDDDGVEMYAACPTYAHNMYVKLLVIFDVITNASVVPWTHISLERTCAFRSLIAFYTRSPNERQKLADKIIL